MAYNRHTHANTWLQDRGVSVDDSRIILEVFDKVVAVYDLHKGDRLSFFYYPHILRRICELKKLECYDRFPLHRNPEKVKEWDDIWDNIKEHYGWDKTDVNQNLQP